MVVPAFKSDQLRKMSKKIKSSMPIKVDMNEQERKYAPAAKHRRLEREWVCADTSPHANALMAPYCWTPEQVCC